MDWGVQTKTPLSLSLSLTAKWRHIRERGVTPNGLMETPWPRWMARDPWATPSCCCCCCCFRGVPCHHLPLGFDEQDLGRKMRGGRCPRGWGFCVSPSNNGRVLAHTCLRDDALFLHKTPSVRPFLTKLCFFSSSSRRICSQSLGRIRVK